MHKKSSGAFGTASAGGTSLPTLSSDAAKTLDALLVAEPFLADVDCDDPEWALAISIVAEMDGLDTASNGQT